MEWDKNTKIIVAVVVVVVVIAAAVGIGFAMNNNNNGSSSDTANVTYDGNGGKTVDGKTSYNSTSTTVQECYFTKEGYTFEKWVEGDKSYNPGGFISGTHTLKASYTQTITTKYLTATFSDKMNITSVKLNGVELNKGLDVVELKSKNNTVEIISSVNWVTMKNFGDRAYLKVTTTNNEYVGFFVAYDEKGAVVSSDIKIEGTKMTMNINLNELKNVKLQANCMNNGFSVLDGDGGVTNRATPYIGYKNSSDVLTSQFTLTGKHITGYRDVIGGKDYALGTKYSGDLTVFVAIWANN